MSFIIRDVGDETVRTAYVQGFNDCGEADEWTRDITEAFQFDTREGAEEVAAKTDGEAITILPYPIVDSKERVKAA
jgi:hypothetical protein